MKIYLFIFNIVYIIHQVLWYTLDYEDWSRVEPLFARVFNFLTRKIIRI